MNIADDLAKLAELRAQGALTHAGFERAKFEGDSGSMRGSA